MTEIQSPYFVNANVDGSSHTDVKNMDTMGPSLVADMCTRSHEWFYIHLRINTFQFSPERRAM